MNVHLGFDITEIGRFRTQVSRHGEDFLRQFLTELELADCEAEPRPFPAYAVRFAAKEAFSKALGIGVMGSMSWHDMAVRRDERGNTILQLTGRAKQAADALGIERVHLSLTHEREIAAAVVLLEGAHRSEP